MAFAADMDLALRNKLIKLQGWTQLLVLLCFSCLLGGVKPQELPEEEMDALQALKRVWSSSTPDFQTTFQTWNSSHPCGDLNSTAGGGGWRGVTCDVSSTGVSVTRLSLKEMGIVGILPSDVSKLSNVEHIDLASNQGLSGPIPKEILQLRNLTKLDLGYNMFSGEFPFESFINESKLQILDISSNQLNGSIGEDTFRNLRQLITLNLASNQFTGQAPNLSILMALKYLDLSRNKFTGQAPNVSKMKYLYTLNLSQNGFTSQTPDVSNLNRLKWLDVSKNNFTGHLPKFSSNAIDLIHINLSSSYFTKTLPIDLWSFLNNLPRNLTVLDLSSLQFGGGGGLYSTNLSFPVSLLEIYLDKNNLTGPLNVSRILQSNVSRTLKVGSLKDNMITDIVGGDSISISFAIGLTKFELQGNPYCKKTWTSQDETRTCNFYCANTCFNPTQPKLKDWNIFILASSICSVVVVLVIILVVIGFVNVLRRKQKYIQDLQKKIKEADINAKRFDYHKLRVATKNFAQEMKLGEGGFGAVYKGILASNDVVAVKQMLLNTDASREDFVNEVLLISNLQHQNLVSLKGYCINGTRQIFLVYEYVDNCDLDKLLLRCQATTKSTSQGLQLWKARLKICQGVAQGLHYLHTFSQFRIIHRDIKASNILVNENFEAKIADFGLARVIVGSVIETNRCAGTFGYLAPEYATQGQLSEKADIYSFGVLLLEIVSGMRNRDDRLPEDEGHLTAWACTLHKRKRLLDMKDPTLIVSEDEAEEVQRVLEIAVLCVKNDPKKRPAMILVAALLAGKANGDELPQIDEELSKLASEESDCDPNLLLSYIALLARRPACDPQTELRSLKNGRLWRTG